MEKVISMHSRLIGEHPSKSIFVEWLSCEDIPCSENKVHRKLVGSNEMREQAIEKISEWIIKHHVSDKKINRLKKRKEQILKKYGYDKHLQNVLPVAVKTMRGNGAEIILSEYLQETSQFETLVYRLRFNSNVNQSMKGDDVLLFNKENLQEKVLLGESKFRKTPSKDVVEEITKDFGTQIKLPLSILFVAERMSDFGEDELAAELEDLNIDIERGAVPVINVGFLLSNQNTAINVERNLFSKNPNFLFVSLGIEQPDEFLARCFEKANEKLRRSILNE